MTPSISEGKDNPYNWVLLDEDGREVDRIGIRIRIRIRVRDWN